MLPQTDNRPIRILVRRILLLVATAYVATLYYVWQENLRNTEATLTHINGTLVNSMHTALAGHELLLRAFGQELIQHGALSEPENGRELIERMTTINSGMAGFGLANAEGQLLLVSGTQPGDKLPNLAKGIKTRDSFNELVSSPNLRVGRPYFFNKFKQWVVPIRTPIFDDNEKLIAVMVAGYNINGSGVDWYKAKLPDGVQVAVARDDGYLIYSNPLIDNGNENYLHETFGQPLSSVTQKQIREFKKQAAFGRLQTPRLDNENQFVAYHYCKKHNLHFGTILSTSKVITDWLKHIAAPTVIFIIFLLIGNWAFRHATRRQDKSNKEITELNAWKDAVLDGADYAIISTDTDGTIVSFNRTAQQLLGYKAEEVIGKCTPLRFHDGREIQQYASILSQETGKHIEPSFDVLTSNVSRELPENREWTYIRKDGTPVPVHISISSILNEKLETAGFLSIASDLTDRKAMQDNLRESEKRYRTLFDSAGDAIMLLNDGLFIDCNPAALKLFGCQRRGIIGRSPQELSPEFQPNGQPSSTEVYKHLQAVFNGEPQTFDWQHIRVDGTTFDAEINLSSFYVMEQPRVLAVVRDATERKEFEVKLAYQAKHDSLTGLPNRISLHEAFEEFTNKANSDNKHTALMLLDLDRFKEVNDTLGHHAGDEVLAQIGPRLKRVHSNTDTFFTRLGGDEFAILVRFNGDFEGQPTDLKELAGKYVATLCEPFQVGTFKVTVGASVGIACYPEHGRDSHELLRAADVAMYQAKKLSLGIMFYERTYDDYSTQRLALGGEFLHAIQNKQLILHYQPKIDIATGRVISLESLIRWQHPIRGLLYPDAFIDLIEMSELIHPFTREVIELAVADRKKLKQGGFNQSVAINLSARNLLDDSCTQTFKSALQSNNISANEVEIELTESALMQEPETSYITLNKFNEMGIAIAIDDFGTGYSSLSYLRKLPVSFIKIDRSFVIDMLEDPQDAAIVRSTIALAQSLDLKVIAEGVEKLETLEMLREMKCDMAQGYGICRPQALGEIMAWMEERKESFK